MALSVSEFAGRIKSKYPQYASIDDETLTQKMLAKYPSYSSQVDTAALQPAQEERMTFAEAAAPRQTELARKGVNIDSNNPLEKDFWRGLGAKGSDALSFVGRALAASPAFAGTMAGGGDVDQALQEFYKEMAKKTSDQGGASGFAENLIRDPATVATLPIGGGAGAGVAKTGIKAAASAVGRMAAQGAKQGAVSAAAHGVENFADTGNVDAGAIAAETAFGAAAGGGLSAAGKVARYAAGKLPADAKTIISKFTGIDQLALERAAKPNELRKIKQAMIDTGGDLDKASDDVVRMIEDVRNRAQSEFESGVMKNRPGGAIEPSGVSALQSGESIGEAAATAKAASGERFGRAQEIVMDKSGAGQRPLPAGSPKGRDLIPKGSGGIGQGNVLQDEVDNLLDEVGYDPAKGWAGTERMGSKAVSKKAIGKLEEAKAMFANAKNTQDALTMRRQIQNDISFGGENGGRLFPSGSDDDILMGKLYGKINDVVEKQVLAQANDIGVGEDLARLWRANNEAWKNTTDILTSVQDGTRMGRANVEEYFGKIKDIGITDLKKLKDAAGKDQIVKPVWDEIQKGFFDNMIKKSLKDGRIDVRSFQKIWNGIDEDLKKTMLAKDAIANVKNALRNTQKYGADLPEEIGQGIVGKSTDSGLATKRLENLGTKDKRRALAELRFLEDIQGIPEKERISTKALDVYAGKQLSMTPEGRLPGASIIRTGKANQGAGAGAAAGATAGAAIAGPVGAAIGSFAGVLAGSWSQSPAGAVAAIRALNLLDTVVKKQGVRNEAKALGAAASNRVTQQAIRSNVFRKDEDEENAFSGLRSGR